ncbi:MAG: ABC transporter ATP-binding protein [Clostridium sp.]|uniref:ABC transporter ATP-binding protein n=1 Tax=Clostridium sp. TaxID=1506 RepID=UPI003F3869B4
MKRTIIEFKDFSFKYNAQKEKTLKNINLKIYEGEKVLIVGPSGSGKSTLSSCINGVAPFLHKGEMEGNLIVDDIKVQESSIFELSNKVGTVLQDPDGQFIGLTVAEDIAFKLENDCIETEVMKKKVKEVSKIVEVSELLDSRPHDLSGGQKQRVTLGGVMINDSKILLFDEPLASLDPKTGERAVNLIDKINREEGKTVIIIEHRLEDVLHIDVDRIILINDGQVLFDGNREEILEKDILRKNGIREPLYITLLRYAGAKIENNINLKGVETLNLEKVEKNIEEFIKNTKLTHVEEEKETLLEFKNVDFSYSEKKDILKNINFKVKKGEIFSIVGKNGAGKSTLSKLICGFYKVSNGEILFKGKNINNETIKERGEKIGLVMQNPNQMISNSFIYDEVSFGLKLKGLKEEEIKKRVLEVLKICNLYPFRNWPISALSYGQKKRVTIASILALNPEILILDEPTAGQDFKSYLEIMEFLKKLNRNGVTIIFITHDMHLMLEYTDRALVLADGEILKLDKPSSILTNEEIIEKANLKRTSIYNLGKRFGEDKPKKLMEAFVEMDRRER